MPNLESFQYFQKSFHVTLIYSLYRYGKRSYVFLFWVNFEFEILSNFPFNKFKFLTFQNLNFFTNSYVSNALYSENSHFGMNILL